MTFFIDRTFLKDIFKDLVTGSKNNTNFHFLSAFTDTCCVIVVLETSFNDTLFLLEFSTVLVVKRL